MAGVGLGLGLESVYFVLRAAAHERKHATLYSTFVDKQVLEFCSLMIL
jgi:hypothetical protein